MTQFEQAPPFERPCATCPNRSKVSRALARIGLLPSGESCPGADIIDRFTAVKIVGAEPFPEDSNDFSPQPTIEYLAQDHVRTKPCSKDPILMAPDEIVTRAQRNDLGRVTAEIGKGDRENIEVLRPTSDLKFLNDGLSPLEVLRKARQVIIDSKGTSLPKERA